MRNEDLSSTNGSARISPDEPVVAGSRGTWTITYTAGPDGLAIGGSVRFEIPYGFTPPQLKWPGDDGHVSAPCSRRGVRLQLSLDPLVTLDPEPFYYVTRWGRMVYVQVRDEALVEGDSISFEYGRQLHAPVHGGATVQHFAQTVEFTVATDVDGTRSAGFSGYTLLADQPSLKVIGGKMQRRQLFIPSVVAAHDEFDVRVLSVDEHGNSCKQPNSWPDSYRVPGEYLLVENEHPAPVRSNPVLCLPQEPELKLFWGDIHGHTILSDGLGSPADYYAFGREESLLDFCAIADHAQYMSDEDWELTRETTRQFHDPHNYVTLLGYEYSCNAAMEHYGDKCVYYPGDEGPLLRETDIHRGPYRDMAECAPIWKQHGAMMVLHQHARGTCSYYDPDLVRLCEVYSIWGNSEGEDSGHRRLLPAQQADYSGHCAADALAKGWLLGLIASSDDHAGRPGNSDWLRVCRGYPGGLVAVYAPELTRGAVWDALWNRRCYGTTGARIILEFHVDGEPMGSLIPGSAFRGGHQIQVRVLGDAPLAAVEILRGREVIHSETSFNCSLRVDLRDEAPPGSANYYYVRVRQADGEMAWSSPVWVV